MDCVILTTALFRLLAACRDKLSANHSPQESIGMTINLNPLATTQCVYTMICVWAMEERLRLLSNVCQNLERKTAMKRCLTD